MVQATGQYEQYLSLGRPSLSRPWRMRCPLRFLVWVNILPQMLQKRPAEWPLVLSGQLMRCLLSASTVPQSMPQNSQMATLGSLLRKTS